MATNTKFVSVELNDNGTCKRVLLCKNITEKEYKELLNQQELSKQKELENDYLFKLKIANIEKHNCKHDLFIAKATYDNLVDRGLIDDDKAFQKLWFDFLFNNGELDLDKCPDTFNKIYAKVEIL